MLVRQDLFISPRGSHKLTRLLAASCLTVAMSMSLVLSQRVFASQSDTPHQMTASGLPQNQSLMADEPAAADAKESPDDSWRVVRMRVTAYCPCSKCCGAYSDGITACNHHIQNGDRFVAADKRYPFGTEMIIPGYNQSNPVQVKDRGGAIKNDKLDVFFNTHEEALVWGVQYLDVLVKVQ
ncbi:MAG: 3D domain-containing protein [Planctomycetota bacterium]